MKWVLPSNQFEDIIAPLPSNRRSALLSHDAVLRAAITASAGANEERSAIVSFLRETAGDGTTVRAKHALKLAEQIEAGLHHAS
jgi:hypothetical protein